MRLPVSAVPPRAKFAKSGACVGLLARGPDGLEGAREEIEAAGGKALVLPTDVADPSQVEAAADAVERELGPIDVWVNNAMVSILAPLAEVSSEEFRRVTEVTYLGYVWGTMSALKRMRAAEPWLRRPGWFGAGVSGDPSASRVLRREARDRGFTESVRCELLHDRSRVRLTVVELPGLNTPQFEWIRNRMPHKSQPVGKIYQPEVAARAIVWAAHHDRRELHVGTPTVEAILGERISWITTWLARSIRAIRQTSRTTRSARTTCGIPCPATRRAWSVRRSRQGSKPATLGNHASPIARGCRDRHGRGRGAGHGVEVKAIITNLAVKS
ncbi:MAG: SDR family NAD(P)-dependent oxidoreductase [Tepidisphaeraceae bacterium]